MRPTLVACLSDCETRCAITAQRLLVASDKRWGDVFGADAFALGLEKAFTFRATLAATAADAAARQLQRGGASPAAAGATPSRAPGAELTGPEVMKAFGDMWAMVAGRSTWRPMLSDLLRRFGHAIAGDGGGECEAAAYAAPAAASSRPPLLPFLAFCATVLGSLPMSSAEHVLHLLYMVNAEIARAGAMGGAGEAASTSGSVEQSAAVALLLLLKRHLKRAYGVNDTKALAPVAALALHSPGLLAEAL